jgi:hypothetical protein
MNKKFWLPALLALATIAVHAQTDTSRLKLYFNTGNHRLTPAHKTEMMYFFDTLTALPPSSIIITGSTDDEGTPAFNYQLGMKRAKALRDYLVDIGGVSPSVITEVSLGENAPVISNSNEKNKRLNRYAEVTFIIPLPATTFAQPVMQPEEPGDLAELFSQLSQKPQSFCIDVTRDTLIVGNKGTIIHYKANTIQKSDINCRCFTLLLNEYYDNSDLILNNLTTTSDGQLLESGGMMRLQGFCDGQPYTLKPGQYLTVMVPTDTILPGMKLLSANRDADSSYLNWKLDAGDELDDFDYWLMLKRCGYRGSNGSMAKCPFFFCRISDFFRGIFGERKYKNSDRQNNEQADKELALLKKYELKGEDLETALRKSHDKAGKDALKYYVYKNSSWDYRNIDRYAKGQRFVNFIVDNNPDKETDVKLMYKGSRTVVPCFERASSYLFKSVNESAALWAVGLRFTRNKQILLAIKEEKASEKRTHLDFQPVTVEELKSKLKMLDNR